MKINAVADPQRVLNGYYNLCYKAKAEPNPLGVEYTFTQITGDYTTIGWIEENVCDGEAEEIILYNTLENFFYDTLTQKAAVLAAKLKHGGTLKIICLDFFSLCQATIKQNLTVPEINTKLGGHSVLTLPYCVSLLKQVGLTIKMQGINGLDFNIVAERP